MNKIIFIIFFLANCQISFAYIFYSKSATSILNKPGRDFLISEISIKNNDPHYLKITSTSDKNLKGFSIWMNQKIFSFTNNFQIQKAEEIKIIFNQKKEFIRNLEIEIKTEKILKNTEVTLLNKHNQIVDAICLSEKRNINQELIDLKEWKGPCLDTSKIGLFKRKSTKDSNSSKDWLFETKEEVKESMNDEKEEGKTKKEVFYPNIIQISEFLPNPKGSDKNQEWIELYNPSPTPIDLTDWQLDDEETGSKAYTFKNTVINAFSYLLVPNSESKINLNNSEDSVRLIDPNGLVQREISYEKAPENQSFLSEFQSWTKALTPGFANVLRELETEVSEIGDLSKQIKFSEVFPNPKGPDKSKEWLELYNSSDKSVNLNGWSINQNKLEKLVIEPNSYLIIDKISLKNQNAELELTDFEETVVDTLKYEKSKEDKSYAKTNLGWQWLKSSKGKINPQILTIEGKVTAISENSLELETNEMENTKIITNNKDTIKLLNINDFIKLKALIDEENQLMLHQIEEIEKAIQPKNLNESKKHNLVLLIAVSILLPALIILLIQKLHPKIQILKIKRQIKKRYKKLIL